jgi:uncharacterized repeat protein (TIGR02543 family)
VVQGGKVTKPADPTRAGYTFAGWYKDAAKTTLWNFDTDTVTAATTIYAKWLAAYTVTFNVDGGSAVAAQTVVQGGKASKPVDPTRAGYTFAGWYKDAAKTTPWNFDTDTVTAVTTIYAKWLATYTVTFNVDVGSAVPAQTVVQGGKVTKPADPTKPGNAFTGWYYGDTLWDFSQDTVTQAITLTARWIEALIVTFSGFKDEEIDLSQEGELTLSKSKYDEMTVFLSGVENYESIRWYRDGSYWDSYESHNIYAYSLSLGPHTLSAVVVKDGVPYSKTLTFTVSK